MKKLMFLFFSFLLILLTINTKVSADSIGVSPGKLVFNNANNFDNDFLIYNPNDNDFDFDIYSEPLDWIEFIPNSGTIEPKGKTKVTTKLIIPKKTKIGKYNTFIYVNSNPNKNNNNVTLIKTSAGIKAEIIIKEKTKPSLLIGLIIIITIIIIGVLVWKKINIFR